MKTRKLLTFLSFMLLKKRIMLTAMLLMLSCMLNATPVSGVEMADVLRSSGKIYVVIATIAIIFLGLSIYLFSIDQRLRKIEKERKVK